MLPPAHSVVLGKTYDTGKQVLTPLNWQESDLFVVDHETLPCLLEFQERKRAKFEQYLAFTKLRNTVTKNTNMYLATECMCSLKLGELANTLTDDVAQSVVDKDHQG